MKRRCMPILGRTASEAWRVPRTSSPPGDFFCPSLRIEHDESAYDVSFDAAGFERFIAAVFA